MKHRSLQVSTCLLYAGIGLSHSTHTACDLLALFIFFLPTLPGEPHRSPVRCLHRRHSFRILTLALSTRNSWGGADHGCRCILPAVGRPRRSEYLGRGVRGSRQKDAHEVGVNGPQSSFNATRALELHLVHGLSQNDVARVMNTDVGTVSRRLKPFVNLLTDPAAVLAFRANEANILDALRMRLVERMAEPELIASANLQQLAFCYYRINDAARLLRGQSTSNVGLRATLVLKAHRAPGDPQPRDEDKLSSDDERRSAHEVGSMADVALEDFRRTRRESRNG